MKQSKVYFVFSLGLIVFFSSLVALADCDSTCSQKDEACALVKGPSTEIGAPFDKADAEANSLCLTLKTNCSECRLNEIDSKMKKTN